ncbi:phosphoglycerate mutase [Sphingopyxis sp. Root214]|uniref:histidine phosphatase family protein n=1 Tax=unclassified Sphingopyxis TaxID=2614943 RepID=UPI000701C9F1|nr:MULTISPECIES: histidine phosphatase family protein [unclassified Sphingopyxis]KQZ73685.1 phosphoglycerate mutase [Sphingopyxis sp. Root154]KRC07826.1 phosphoglycerate mutase [Sphingopyxis sp. Root214]
MTGFALHLLRHGAPETPGLLMGRTDGVPTPEGIAACVAHAEDLGIELLIASDLHRSCAAGEAIGAALGVPLIIDPRWRELDFGDWDGKAASTINLDALGRFWSDPDANPPPGGEHWSALVARVSAAIADLAPVPTLIVTHGGAMRAALHALCGFDQRQLWAFDLPYAARLSLRAWPGEPASAQITGLYP